MEIQWENCGYCGCCVTVCPENIIELAENTLNISEGCTECGKCVSICPLGALQVRNTDE
jgi:ferredoxin